MKGVELTKGMTAFIDDEDYERASKYNWYYHHTGYAYTNSKSVDGKRYSIPMHRFIMNAKEGFEVDHRNGHRLDNQKHNLRICKQSDNAKNRTKKKGKNAFKGVLKNGKNYQVSIKVNNESIFLGTFKNEIAGANCYNHHARIYHGEFAKLNEVEYMEDWINYKVIHTSQFRGVSWSANREKWTGQILVDKKKIWLGYFDNELDCALAYNRAVTKYGCDKSWLNNVDLYM